MLRSMFTAISSLNLHQTYLDMIADNLANANTNGFKASRLVFQDQFAQIVNSGSAPTETQGGINPTQIGLGIKLGYIAPVFTQGTIQSTGRSTDLAIQGDGFFIYNKAEDRSYSREGSMDIDASSYLVNRSTGQRVQGWQLEPGQTEVDTNQPIGDILIPLDSTLARETTKATLAGNLNSAVAVSESVQSTFGVYDSLGVLHPVTVEFTRTGDNDWDWEITSPAGAGSGTITFNTDGQYDSDTGSDSITFAGSDGADALDFSLDFSKLTMLATSSSVSASSQNGLAAGSVTDLYTAPNTGEIYLVYSNGLKQKVGQLALARFTNPAGLVRVGENLFKAGLNSGEAMIGTPNSNGRGSVTSGALEASNVDMAQEFTNLILAQRGFQASSRVISTSDEILQELVNLKR